MIKSDNLRNFNELRRLFVYIPPCLGVHTDTAYFIFIQRIMSNFAAEKIAVTPPKRGWEHDLLLH